MKPSADYTGFNLIGKKKNITDITYKRLEVTEVLYKNWKAKIILSKFSFTKWQFRKIFKHKDGVISYMKQEHMGKENSNGEK
jgi:hypothetical protein